jgi:hypothetical protein
MRSTAPTSVSWPVLAVADWEDTLDTLHMWAQIVGKVRLALEPMINHWWQVPLYVSSRGLTTSLMHSDGGPLELTFDFQDHVLAVSMADGRRHAVALEPRSVASFYAETMDCLHALSVDVPIFDRPVEVTEAIPFPDDERHRAYDPDSVHAFWLQLVNAHRVMMRFRGEFIGKASPVHFFWGAPDLAVSRFSGRRAPKRPAGGVPNCPDWVQELAYSHEVSSCGFWPGGSEEGSFYSYAYPDPDGFAEWPVRPDGASYDAGLGEFILPYRTVRQADDPDATLLAFFRSTYEAAAELADWDRAALEAPPGWARSHRF